jgi:cysteine desulfurase/selenocysteine lyase
MTEPLDESLLRWRPEFAVTAHGAYLNHAAVSPIPRRAAERVAELARSIAASGDRLWPERNEGCEAVRRQAARLLGARHPHEVAFVENTSTGLSLVAQGIDWRPGDNVVGAACEFPSNVYPWLQLGEKGVELRLVPERGGRVEPAELLDRMDDRTRVLALSWVEYASGFRSDLAALGRECRARGVLFVVDVIQGLGALALDVERDQVDVCCGASHKWLLGPEGIGLLYVADHVTERVRPTRAGWRSMRDQLGWRDFRLDWGPGALRHESGTLNVLGIHALGGALDLLLEVGPAAIERRILALADRAARGLAELGLEVVSPRSAGETSGIVAALHPRHSAGELVDRLAERRVIVAERAGRLRISPHFYNTSEEIDQLLTELSRL